MGSPVAAVVDFYLDQSSIRRPENCWKSLVLRVTSVLDALGQPLDLDTEWTVLVPDKLRLQMTVAVQGQTANVLIILNGEKMWFLVNGGTEEGSGVISD